MVSLKKYIDCGTQREKIMTDNTIIEHLHNYLPKDLVYIVEEYLKDRTNYDTVLREFEQKRINSLASILKELNVSWHRIEDDMEFFIDNEDFLNIMMKRVLNISTHIGS